MNDEYQVTSCESAIEVPKALQDEKGKAELQQQLTNEIAGHFFTLKIANKPPIIYPAKFLEWVNRRCQTRFTESILRVLEWFHVLMPFCKEIKKGGRHLALSLSVNPEQLGQIVFEDDEDYFRALISIPPEHIPPALDDDTEAAVVKNPHLAFAHGNIELDGKDVTPVYEDLHLFAFEDMMKVSPFDKVKNNEDMYQLLAHPPRKVKKLEVARRKFRLLPELCRASMDLSESGKSQKGRPLYIHVDMF